MPEETREHLRKRYAEALAAKFTEPIYYEDRARQRMQVRFVGGGGLPSYRDVSCEEAAEVCAAVRDEQLERSEAAIARVRDLAGRWGVTDPGAEAEILAAIDGTEDGGCDR